MSRAHGTKNITHVPIPDGQWSSTAHNPVQVGIILLSSQETLDGGAGRWPYASVIVPLSGNLAVVESKRRV